MLSAMLSRLTTVAFPLLSATKKKKRIQLNCREGRSVWIMESRAPPGKDSFVVRPNVRSRPGRKTLLSAGPDFLSMLIGWSAASGRTTPVRARRRKNRRKGKRSSAEYFLQTWNFRRCRLH